MLCVLFTGTGQMCNQMLMQMNVLASAYERGYQVSYRGFRKYDGPGYSEKTLNDLITVKGDAGFLTRAFIALLGKTGIRPPRFIDASDEKAVYELVHSGRLSERSYYAYGWPFYDLEALRKQAPLIRRHFAPNEALKNEVEERIRTFRTQGHTMIVGVHIRRRDYAIWRNGEFYYEDETYKDKMDQMNRLLAPKHGRVQFLIFSDEKINMSRYPDRNYDVLEASGSAIQDFYMLSRCDYIISPPSSFSGLASFLGNVPRFIIVNRDEEVTSEKNRVWLMQTDGWINPI